MQQAKPKSHIITFTSPPDIKEILDIIPSLGYYDSLSEFLRDCIRSFFKDNKGIATLVAFHLYKAKRISIGKATILTNASPEDTREMFKSLES